MSCLSVTCNTQIIHRCSSVMWRTTAMMSMRYFFFFLSKKRWPNRSSYIMYIQISFCFYLILYTGRMRACIYVWFFIKVKTWMYMTVVSFDVFLQNTVGTNGRSRNYSTKYDWEKKKRQLWLSVLKIKYVYDSSKKTFYSFKNNHWLFFHMFFGI